MMRLASLFSSGVLAVLLLRTGFGQTVTESFNDTRLIDTAASSSHVLVGKTLRSFSSGDLGTEADGACTVSGTVNLSTGSCADRATSDAVAFSVTTAVDANQTKVRLASAATGLAVGEEVLIINLRGNATTAEQYETRRIQSISTKTLTLDANLTHTYNGSNSAMPTRMELVLSTTGTIPVKE